MEHVGSNLVELNEHKRTVPPQPAQEKTNKHPNSRTRRTKREENEEIHVLDSETRKEKRVKNWEKGDTGKRRS